MKPNFFDAHCKTAIKEKSFGLCDGVGNAPAYANTQHTETWEAKVENPEKRTVDFYAVDACIAGNLRPDGTQESSCDALLALPGYIAFVELKDRKKDWISGGVAQLAATIATFARSHDLKAYQKRRAYLANKAHNRFAHSHKSEMQQFYQTHKVRLLIEGKIVIP